MPYASLRPSFHTTTLPETSGSQATSYDRFLTVNPSEVVRFTPLIALSPLAALSCQTTVLPDMAGRI